MINRKLWVIASDLIVSGALVGSLGFAASSVPKIHAHYSVTGAAKPVVNPQTLAGYQSMGNAGISVIDPRYYIVPGVKIQGLWTYPISVSARHQTIAAIPLKINAAEHREIVEVGIAPSSLLRLASPHGGSSARSRVRVKRRP